MKKLELTNPLLIAVTIIGVACQSTPAAAPDSVPEGPPYHVISGGLVKPPVALNRVIPEKPEGVNERGQVLLKTVVGLDGVARDVQVVKSPHPRLGEVSVEAAKQWRFAPGTLHGKPVETIFFIQITF